MEISLDAILYESAKSHGHLCPRQVLGARMGLLAVRLLNIPQNPQGKPLIIFVETDGCFADGVSAATGCTLGHRTLRLHDIGRVAATFVDVKTERAIRIAPSAASRQLALTTCPDEPSHWHSYLNAYQIVSDEQLFNVKEIELPFSVKDVLSTPNSRVICDECGEEVINQREVYRDGRTLCRACAGELSFQITI